MKPLVLFIALCASLLAWGNYVAISGAKLVAVLEVVK